MSLSSPLLPANPNTLTNGTPADATQVMANFNNIVNNINALLNATTGAGYVGITSDTRWGGGASVQDALGLLKDQQQLTDTGTVNAMVVTPAGSLITANVAGMLFLVKPANTTTNTTPTLQVGTAPALTILNSDGSAHVAGAIQANRPALFWVDTANSKAVHLNPLRVTNSFTLTLATGLTTTPTATINYSISPDTSIFYIWSNSQVTGTSNSAAMTGTGVPVVLQATTNRGVNGIGIVDNGTPQWGNLAGIGTSTWTFGKTYGASGGFTTTGSKGMSVMQTSYTKD